MNEFIFYVFYGSNMNTVTARCHIIAIAKEKKITTEARHQEIVMDHCIMMCV